MAQAPSLQGRNGFGSMTNKQGNVHLKMSSVAEALKNLNLCIVTLPAFQTLKLGPELHISDTPQNVK